MTGGTISYNSWACPVGDTLAMCTSDPISFLPEVTLTAKLIAMVKINLVAFLVFQIIPF